MTEEEITKLCKELIDATKQSVENILKDIKKVLSVYCDDNSKLIHQNESIKHSILKAQISIEKINDDEYKQKHPQEWYGFIDDLREALTKLFRK